MTEMTPEQVVQTTDETGSSSGPHVHFEASDDGLVEYVVAGPQAVHGVKRGGTLHLDPEAAQTERFLAAGHVRPVAGPTEEGE